MRVALSPGGRTLLRLHDSIEGQLSVEESQFLYRVARGRKMIVEIGSFRGKSCAMLALGSAPDGHVTAIDPHISSAGAGRTTYNTSDEQAFHETMARLGVTDRVLHIVKTSADARTDWPDNRAIDLLWIDGDHSYEGITRDLHDWADSVLPGGVLACHDYRHRAGVRQAWNELIEGKPMWAPTRFVRSIAWTVRQKSDHEATSSA